MIEMPIQSEETKIAVLEERIKFLTERMEYFGKLLEKIESHLDVLYLKRSEYENFVKMAEEQHKELWVRMNVLWDWRWKVVGIALGAGAVADIVLRLIPFNFA